MKQDIKQTNQPLKVDKEAQGTRFDVWVSQTLTDISRSKIQRLIKEGKILLNGKTTTARTLLTLNDIISFEGKFEEPLLLSPEKSELKLNLLFEDEFLIVVNKPAGVSVHPSVSENKPGSSLVEALLKHCYQKDEKVWEKDGSERPGVVHRLDKDTTGVLVWAKEQKTLEHLQKQFKEKTNKREYLALLDGYLEEDKVVCESYLYRDPKNKTQFTSSTNKEELEEKGVKFKYAKTTFHKLESYYHKLTLCRVKLDTGRTHQIRVHAARELKLPILGDPVYNKRREYSKALPEELRQEMKKLNRQMLHAEVLGFTHPKTGKILKIKKSLDKLFSQLTEKVAEKEKDKK